MPNDFNLASAGQAGSAGAGPANGGAGEPNTPNVDQILNEKMNLEKKMGEMGQELGELRSFFNGIQPVLTTLNDIPELYQAVAEGKIDATLAKAALEGKLSVQDAVVVTQAHTEVEKELGKKAYEKASVEDISKMVEDKVSSVKQEMQGKFEEMEELRDYQKFVDDFIANTPDFSEYAGAVEEWIDKHPDVTDVTVAYYAVKGQLSEKEAKKQAEINATENAKNLAANAGGGRANTTYIEGGHSVIDDLIGNRSNPNVF